MKLNKDFDCVQMKWDIQQKLLEEERELGRDEARRRREERLRNDPILGPFLQRVESEERRRASAILEQMAGKN
jgi:hypothetical protein